MPHITHCQNGSFQNHTIKTCWPVACSCQWVAAQQQYVTRPSASTVVVDNTLWEPDGRLTSLVFAVPQSTWTESHFVNLYSLQPNVWCEKGAYAQRDRQRESRLEKLYTHTQIHTDRHRHRHAHTHTDIGQTVRTVRTTNAPYTGNHVWISDTVGQAPALRPFLSPESYTCRPCGQWMTDQMTRLWTNASVQWIKKMTHTHTATLLQNHAKNTANTHKTHINIKTRTRHTQNIRGWSDYLHTIVHSVDHVK